MKKLISILICIFLVLGCSSNKTISLQDPPSQASVHIDLVDGSSKEGIIVTGKEDKLIFVNAETHRVDTVKNSQIAQISESVNVYDFYGNTIPGAEISQNKNYKNTLLYGTGGLVLGTAVGFGAFVAILVSDSTQTLAANLTMAAFGITGAAIFSKIGHDRDVEAAEDKVRKIRYKSEQIRMDEDRKKLEELKKQRDQQKK